VQNDQNSKLETYKSVYLKNLEICWYILLNPPKFDAVKQLSSLPIIVAFNTSGKSGEGPEFGHGLTYPSRSSLPNGLPSADSVLTSSGVDTPPGLKPITAPAFQY